MNLTKTPTSSSRCCIPAVVLLALATTACLSLPSSTAFIDATANVEETAIELLVRTTDFGARFSSVVQVASEEIISSTDDSAIRRNALLWQAYAVPASYQASFSIDPLVAFIDLWTLCIQHQAYLETGPGQDLFGEWQHVAVDAAQYLTEDIEAIAKAISTSGDITHALSLMNSWAEEYPVETTLFIRRPVTADLVHALAPESTGALAAAASIDRRLITVSDQLDVLLEQIVRQLGWQVELTASNILEGEEMTVMMAQLTSLLERVERLTVLAESMPAFVHTELNAAFATMTAERIAILLEVDRQRVETLEYLSDERDILLDAVTRERIAVMSAIRDERIAVMGAIRDERIAVMSDIQTLTIELTDTVMNQVHEERVATMAELEAITGRVIGTSTGEVSVVVDHVFLRAGQLMLASVALAGLFGIVIALIWRRKSKS